MHQHTPLSSNVQHLPYPLDAFPAIVSDAAWEVVHNTKAPPALIGMEFLINMSASSQALFDVQLPIGKTSPVSLNCLIVAESGERMSSVHSIVGAPLYKFDAHRRALYEENLAQYDLAMRSWKVMEKGLSRKLTQAIKEEDDIDAAQQELTDWNAQMPVKPRARRLMRQNITERAMMDALCGEGESVAFIGDEGEVIIKGGALDQMGLLNKAWDGAECLVMDRAHGVNVVARQPRVTVAFKAQPKVLRHLIKRRGELMRGSGHWARYLVANPPSTQGLRQSYQFDRSWTRTHAFHSRMQKLLDAFGAAIDSGSLIRKTLAFSPDAKRHWQYLSNEIEGKLGPGGYLQDINDFASKMMEITSRVAALLHIFDEQGGLITTDTLIRASAIVEWHSHEFKRLFSPACNPSPDEQDAQNLGSYLFHSRQQTGATVMLKKDVLLNGPVNSSKRFEIALRLLINRNHVYISTGPKGQHLIVLNQQVFPPTPQYAFPTVGATGFVQRLT